MGGEDLGLSNVSCLDHGALHTTAAVAVNPPTGKTTMSPPGAPSLLLYHHTVYSLIYMKNR